MPHASKLLSVQVQFQIDLGQFVHKYLNTSRNNFLGNDEIFFKVFRIKFNSSSLL